MTTPITTPQQYQAVPVAAPMARRDWCCGTLITDPHTPGCASAPHADEPVDYNGPVVVAPAVESVPEPPPTPPAEVSAAAQRRSYGFTRSEEADLELPSGSLVRYRKLNKGMLLKLNLLEVLDGFTPELLADMRSDDQGTANEAAVKALADPANNAKIFGPIDRVIAASVVIPAVVLVGPTTEDQVNVDDIELEDKVAIFTAAIGEQLDALKSVRGESSSGV
jgi:hypothetical protein